MRDDDIREAVRARYSAVSGAEAVSCCGPKSCCEGGTEVIPTDPARLGYDVTDLSGLPEGSEMGLGCGNPQAIAALRTGEVVLDLGSGGGIDCFLAARQVGPGGRVIGVDMTPDMVVKARRNAEKGGFPQVEFRLGEIEHLPVADQSVDVILSNCVINLSPNKPQVFREAFRVLKSGGRLAISDILATAPLPDEVRKDLALYAGCMAGAADIRDLEGMLAEAGFVSVQISPKDRSREFIRDWAPGRQIENFVVSATIEAVKP